MTRTKIAGGTWKERGEFVQDHFFRVKVEQTRIQANTEMGTLERRIDNVFEAKTASDV
jgi:hypothetical protein